MEIEIKSVLLYPSLPILPPELLALGERMGNVSTGLSEDAITKCLTEIVYCSSDPIQEDNHEQDSSTICLDAHKDRETILGD
nr:PREDICTED: E3 ubiquitin-protein ligase MBR1-like [Musa acuminata subsp. malaccensis]